MKKLIVVAVLVVGAIAYANWVKTGLSATVKISQAILDKLPVGGCAVTVFGTYEVDGGATLGSEIANGKTKRTDVAGANRTDCLDILDTRAPPFFISDQGL